MVQRLVKSISPFPTPTLHLTALMTLSSPLHEKAIEKKSLWASLSPFFSYLPLWKNLCFSFYFKFFWEIFLCVDFCLVCGVCVLGLVCLFFVFFFLPLIWDLFSLVGGFGKLVNPIKKSIADPIVLDEGFAVVVWTRMVVVVFCENGVMVVVVFKASWLFLGQVSWGNGDYVALWPWCFFINRIWEIATCFFDT